jgi:hypothetical protein
MAEVSETSKTLPWKYHSGADRGLRNMCPEQLSKGSNYAARRRKRVGVWVFSAMPVMTDG